MLEFNGLPTNSSYVWPGPFGEQIVTLDYPVAMSPHLPNVNAFALNDDSINYTPATSTLWLSPTKLQIKFNSKPSPPTVKLLTYDGNDNFFVSVAGTKAAAFQGMVIP